MKPKPHDNPSCVCAACTGWADEVNAALTGAGEHFDAMAASSEASERRALAAMDADRADWIFSDVGPEPMARHAVPFASAEFMAAVRAVFPDAFSDVDDVLAGDIDAASQKAYWQYTHDPAPNPPDGLVWHPCEPGRTVYVKAGESVVLRSTPCEAVRFVLLGGEAEGEEKRDGE